MTESVTTFQRIQSAALETFSTHGFEATGIREIAERADIPTSLLYHYSRSKSDLLRQIVEDGLERLRETDERAVELVPAPEGRLVALAAAHVFVHAENARLAKVLDTELRVLGDREKARVLALRDAIDGIWRSVLDAGVAEGVFTLPDPGVSRLALIRMCNGVATWYSPRGRLDVVALAGHFGELVLAATRASRRGAPIHLADLDGPRLDVIQQIVHDTHAGMPGDTPVLAAPREGDGAGRRRRL